MMDVVLPLFNLGSAAVALGLCRAAVAATARHLNTARFEHLGQSLGESLRPCAHRSPRCRSTPTGSPPASMT